jgi:hypothetical protein
MKDEENTRAGNEGGGNQANLFLPGLVGANLYVRPAQQRR